MKLLKVLIACILLLSAGLPLCARQELDRLSTDELFRVLDREIVKRKQYQEIFDAKTDSMRILAYDHRNPVALFRHSAALCATYCHHQSDSALVYANRCLDLADLCGDDKITQTAIMQKAMVYATIGLFTETSQLISELNIKKIKECKLDSVYYGLQVFYNMHMSEYTKGKSITDYSALTVNYCDSMLHYIYPDGKITDVRGAFFVVTRDDELKVKTNEHVAQLLTKWIQTHEPDNRDYAVNAVMLANIYRQRKATDALTDSVSRYLCLSAIADLRFANHEVYSLQILAQLAFDSGNIARAVKYVNCTVDDAQHYNNRLRQTQLVALQSIIHEAYASTLSEQRSRLFIYLVVAFVLLVVMLVAIWYAIRQRRRMSVLVGKLQEQVQLVDSAQQKLRELNAKLHEANNAKEEYIGYFLKLCADYVKKINDFSNMVNRKIKTNQVDDLLRMTSNSKLAESEQKDLYLRFDTAFLKLYPSFIKDVNALLNDESQIVTKKDEILNNELRICALIRLGVKDSAQIAEFTGYSANTIYTYRAKVKNRAIDRHNFENNLMNIGV